MTPPAVSNLTHFTRRLEGTVLNGIGGTPLITIDGIWAKLEYLNPSGSIKAHIAAYMITRAETEGRLVPATQS